MRGIRDNLKAPKSKPTQSESPLHKKKMHKMVTEAPQIEKSMQVNSNKEVDQNSNMNTKFNHFKQEIERRFQRSNANGLYLFPRKKNNHGNSENDNTNNTSYESIINVGKYDLHQQNYRQLTKTVNRKSPAVNQYSSMTSLRNGKSSTDLHLSNPQSPNPQVLKKIFESNNGAPPVNAEKPLPDKKDPSYKKLLEYLDSTLKPKTPKEPERLKNESTKHSKIRLNNDKLSTGQDYLDSSRDNSRDKTRKGNSPTPKLINVNMLGLNSARAVDKKTGLYVAANISNVGSLKNLPTMNSYASQTTLNRPNKDIPSLVTTPGNQRFSPTKSGITKKTILAFPINTPVGGAPPPLQSPTLNQNPSAKLVPHLSLSTKTTSTCSTEKSSAHLKTHLPIDTKNDKRNSDRMGPVTDRTSDKYGGMNTDRPSHMSDKLQASAEKQHMSTDRYLYQSTERISSQPGHNESVGRMQTPHSASTYNLQQNSASKHDQPSSRGNSRDKMKTFNLYQKAQNDLIHKLKITTNETRNPTKSGGITSILQNVTSVKHLKSTPKSPMRVPSDHPQHYLNQLLSNGNKTSRPSTSNYASITLNKNPPGPTIVKKPSIKDSFDSNGVGTTTAINFAVSRKVLEKYDEKLSSYDFKPNLKSQGQGATPVNLSLDKNKLKLDLRFVNKTNGALSERVPANPHPIKIRSKEAYSEW
jgi:hypothetical protein